MDQKTYYDHCVGLFSICVLAFAFVRVLNTQFRFYTYLGTVENLKKSKCNTANSEILLVGDSHATAIESLIYSFLSGECFKASDKIVTFHNSIKQSREQKQRNFYEISSVEKIKSEIDKSSSKVVVISQYWQAYFSSNKMAYESSDWLVGGFVHDDRNIDDYKEAFKLTLNNIENLLYSYPEKKFILMLPMPDFNWVSRGGPPTGVCRKEWFRPDVDELEVCKKYMSPVNVSVEKVESRRKNIVLSFKSLQQRYENFSAI